MPKERTDDSPSLKESQKQQLLVNEIIGWQNGLYINEILVGAARRLNDKQAIEALDTELAQSHKFVDEFKREYLRIGGKERDFEIPNEIKIRLLDREILQRQEAEYVLKLRSQAAEAVKNKQLADRATEDLAKVLGYLDVLKKELKAVRAWIKKASNVGSSYSGVGHPS